jgi:hypothetical protein
LRQNGEYEMLGQLAPYSCENRLNCCEVRKVDNDDDYDYDDDDVIIQFSSCLLTSRVNIQTANYRNGTAYKHK